VIEDIDAEPRWRAEIVRGLGFRSAMAAPVQVRGQTVGVLTAVSRQLRRISHEDVSVLTALAYLLSVVLERQQGEERLAQGQKMEALGQLTGGVAHDFNNILTVVLGNLQLLDDLLQTQPAAHKLAAAATHAAQRGADLTRKLLTFARKQPLAPRAIAVGAFLQAWAELLTRTLDESIQVSIGACDPELIMQADPGLLETALLNLALNARDAMPHGGRERVLLVEDDEGVRVLAEAFLEALGYRVVAASTAARALELLDGDAAFDLLFSDVVLPGGLSGPQLAQIALERVPTLRALLASGYPRDALAGLDGELADVVLLSKPYSRDDLARAVRQTLDGR
jgi:signal transduction histidine kinase